MYTLDIINTNGTGTTLWHSTGNNFKMMVKEAWWYANILQMKVEANIIDNSQRKIVYSIISK